MNRKILGIPLWVPLVSVGLIVLLLVISILSNWGSVLNAGEDVLEFIFRPDQRVDEVVQCSESDGCVFVHSIIYSAVLLFVLLTGFAYTTLLERKFIAWFQQRVGPNRVGPGGLLQPLADGIKLIFKEDILPTQVNKVVYRLAPMIKVIPVLVVLAVIPLGPEIIVPWFDGNWYQVPLHLIDPGVGVLWILGITSLATYGVVLAGWSSSNKYSMLGGMRASAQMVSYELSMGITFAVPVLLAGSLSIGTIVQDQGGMFWNWYIFQNPLAAIILMIALVAETNRAPFDLPEAEQELTAGYMTEYSGMKFALFMMAEYLGMIGVSLIASSLFLGGYNDGFGLVDHIPILGPLVLTGKVVLFLIGFIWIRATLPRLRYDRLMMFGWKVMLPLSIIAVIWTAVAVIIGEEFGSGAYIVFSGVMIVLLMAGSVFFLGRPQQDDTTDDVEDDPIITGERDGVGYALLMVLAGLAGIPFALYNATAPLVKLGYNFTVVPLLALLNIGENRDKVKQAVVSAAEYIAGPQDDAADQPKLGSGD